MMLMFGLAATLLADLAVRPRGRRSLAGMVLHLLLMAAMTGLFQALIGAFPAALLMAVLLFGGLVLVSNAKTALLGEPLLFCDLALVAEVARQPQFYVNALRPWQQAALAAGALLLAGLIVAAFGSDARAHLAGAALAAAALLALRLALALPPWRRLAPTPDASADVARHGLLAALLLHWWRWRQAPDVLPLHAGLPAPPSSTLVIIIQCESFADPAEVLGAPPLPGLLAARRIAWAHGDLLVPGFGAYTHRTEYGVIFGRSEAALGFRRHDPYLTARRDIGHGLPARLARHGWTSLFVHPHDLRFYNRHRIMPVAGFAELIGAEAFAPPTGRYVSDAAIADLVMARARAAAAPCLIHAVTIENHGPWPDPARWQALAANGDAMLTRLITDIAALRRPAILAFYGDHRPSIPGASVPGGDRHTPFVIIRFGADGQPIIGSGRRQRLTPAGLHQALIAAITSASPATAAPAQFRAAAGPAA